MKLLELILGLAPTRIEELAARWHIPIDAKKRLTAAEQVARGMVSIPRWLEQAKLSEGAREAMRLLAAAPRGMALTSLPEDVHTLIEQGFVYLDPQRSARALLPAAFRLQVAASPSDTPRAARLLLGGVPEDARRELCQYHLQRLPPLPWTILLETPLERLEDGEWVKQELTKLSDAERALLSAIDGVGGEATGEEVLELSREPVRIAHGGSVQVPRRSAIFALARRGLALARNDGWVIPDEVERVVGRERRVRAGVERQRLLMSRHVLDLTPSRAEHAEPPSLLAAVLLAELASHDQLPHEGRGLSRIAVRRAAVQLVIAPERAELLACLARGDGLVYATTPLSAVNERLWNAWRRGGAWDEAAREPDMFRPGHPTTAKATQLVRESLLETLTLLPAQQFALATDVLATAASDRRAPAAQRALALAARQGQDVLSSVADLSRVVLERSLPFLGLLDVGQIGEGKVVRLSAAARQWYESAASDAQSGDGNEPAPRSAAEWRGDLRLWCGGACSIAALLEAARYGRAWLDGSGVSVEWTNESLSRGADHDSDLAGLRAALSSLVEALPPSMQQALTLATAERPLFGLTKVAGFLDIEDAALRRALYEDADGRDVFAAPPLAEGLLVRNGVSESRLHALLMRHGARLFTRS